MSDMKNLSHSQMTTGEYIADLVGSEPVSTALVAGAGSVLVFGANSAEAVSFGAIAALSKGVGSYILTWAGSYVDLNTYFGSYGTALDPNDFIGTALAFGVVQYAASGASGPDLYKAMGVAGVAGVLAPKLAVALHNLAYDPGTQKKGTQQTAY
jgi:hypothetical protein